MLTISVVVFVAIVTIDLLTPVPPAQRLRLLREELSNLRTAADSCLAALELEEEQLRASDARFDSLRNLIEHYEGLDPAGVPAESYDSYLQAFRAYNRGIPARAAAGDTLRSHWQACRDIVALHNQVADSALDIARELGKVSDSLIREPVPAGSAATRPR
ncbi:MAG: hypothetical protein JSU87_18245 [Gemmatimonadota bacterium]|nr:MAG: hypothetical protein JSU87_18245 [Gemmatimonadota bacterium]